MEYKYVDSEGKRFIVANGSLYYSLDSFDEMKASYFLYVNSKEYLESQRLMWFGY